MTRYEEDFYRDFKLLVKELREIKEELRELRTVIQKRETLEIKKVEPGIVDVPKVMPLDQITSITMPNSCSECAWFKDLAQKGTTYIGDSPCDYCSKRQPKCEVKG